jgi:mannose-1-phosphate guanylyltransferase/mannose-6-phosphate isomerase
MKIIPVILSGGSGKRLWPLSRKEYPKQYLKLVGDNTMLQETILRLKGVANISDPIIICNMEHRFLVLEQCQQIGVKKSLILLEPIGRNTAPAIAAAALQSIKNSDDSILLVLSADHLIQDVDAFHQAINIASQQLQDGKLVTFGVVPTNANTSYGYIKFSKKNGNGAYNVEKFIEKPDLKNAEHYLGQGNYLWNSGMFMFQALNFIDELIIHAPNIFTSVNNAVNNAKYDLDFIRLEEKDFESSPSISIDFALMEKSSNVVVGPLDVGWKDIGAWPALYDIGKKDSQGNVINGDVIIKDTTNTYINAGHHMVTAIGVDNLIIVDTPDATLIATHDKAQEVASIVKLLKARGRSESAEHRKVYRPWGWYNTIESGEYFQVKRLYVKPGAKLSLQMHQKRAEHWVVVSGKASVTNDKQTFTLNKGESTYIPLGATHALENKTKEPLEVIEVQSGVYLGEDDIIRFEDVYGRVDNKIT